MARSIPRASSASEDEGDQVLPEALATGRSKRSTAGNRMRALLDQEFEEEEGFSGNEDDVEFEEKLDEVDIIDSDFDKSSSNEDAGSEDDEEGERQLLEEENAAAKRSKSSKGKAGSSRGGARPAPPAIAAFRPSNGKPPPSALMSADQQDEGQIESRASKRISFAPVPPDGEASGPSSSGPRGLSASGSQRSSNRRATMRVAAEVQQRLKSEQAKRASQPVRQAPRKRARLTQDALIAQALEVEDVNRESLRKFLDQEEERRARDRRLVPKTIEGPYVRWHSISMAEGHQPSIIVIEPTMASSKSENHTSALSALRLPLTQDPVFADRAARAADMFSTSKGQTAGQSADRAGQPTKKFSRTLLSLRGLPEESTWVDEFRLLLGDHCQWDALPVVPARNRPLRPRQSTCPITGLPAVYRDPRTGTPFATCEAYEVIGQLLNQRYAWTGVGTRERQTSSGSGAAHEAFAMGCYVNALDDEGADGSFRRAAEAAGRPIVTAVDHPSTNASAQMLGGASASTSTIDSRAPSQAQAQSRATGLREDESASPASKSAPRKPHRRAPTWTIVKDDQAPAPGDELSVLAAAQALPEGSTRSGGRRVHSAPRSSASAHS
ncbi:DNA-binding protein YL1 and related proteins [Ceraceosorus bombacis]|uniref:DNA-binding protein YL1 and related proteins n=1 Tax=Ceraceosorus bombacis TaxID=401625 RepID=A0A0P1BRC9_9BASI|nr:DNA-binding protein YL1 and related proteins [Ceraceosorus bombacis]